MIRVGIPILTGSNGWLDISIVEMLVRSNAAHSNENSLKISLVIRTETVKNLEHYQSFISLFHEIIFWAPQDISSSHSSKMLICHNREELFQLIDVYFPLPMDVWTDYCAISWIPDLQHRFFPNSFSGQEYENRERDLGKIARESRYLIVNSQMDEQNFRTFFPESKAIIRILPFPTWVNFNTLKLSSALAIAENIESINSFPLNFENCINEAIQIFSHSEKNPSQENKSSAIIEVTEQILVSAIVSAYNSAKLLPACLEDLAAQTLGNKLEVIVVDSGSEQDEGRIVESFRHRIPNLHYIRSAREPLYAAWNRGVNLARGKYITNANTDDSHTFNALEILAKKLDQNPEADFAYAWCDWTNIPNAIFGKDNGYRNIKYPKWDPAQGMLWCFLGPHPMWRKSLFSKTGIFDPNFFAAGDLEFQIRTILHNSHGILVPETLSLFYQNPEGLTYQNQRSSEEITLINGRYRKLMPIGKLWKIDSENPEAVARAWTAQGCLALNYTPPWLDDPVLDPQYALLCFKQALQVSPNYREAINGLEALGERGHPAETPVHESLLHYGKKNPSLERATWSPVSYPNSENKNPTVALNFSEVKTIEKKIHRSDKPGFNIIGFLTSNIGLGVAARNTVKLLKSLGYEVALLDIDSGLGRSRRDLSLDIELWTSLDPMPHAINLFHINPYEVGMLMREPPSSLRIENHLNICVPFWELSRIPNDWVPILESMDAVLAPTQFVANAIASCISKTAVRYYPQTVDLPSNIFADRARWNLPENAIVFGFSFDFTSVFERKNPIGVIQLFLKVFTGRNDVILMIKMNHIEAAPKYGQIASKLEEFTCEHRNIRFIRDSIPYNEVMSLMACWDVYVSLHRAEGLGLGMMECMSMGKAALATGWSGNMDFMHEGNSVLVKHKLIPVDPYCAYAQLLFGENDLLWADPDLDDAAVWMKRLVEDPLWRKRLGENARASMLARDEEVAQGKVFTQVEEIFRLWKYQQSISAKSIPIVKTLKVLV